MLLVAKGVTRSMDLHILLLYDVQIKHSLFLPDVKLKFYIVFWVNLAWHGFFQPVDMFLVMLSVVPRPRSSFLLLNPCWEFLACLSSVSFICFLCFCGTHATVILPQSAGRIVMSWFVTNVFTTWASFFLWSCWVVVWLFLTVTPSLRRAAFCPWLGVISGRTHVWL